MSPAPSPAAPTGPLRRAAGAVRPYVVPAVVAVGVGGLSALLLAPRDAVLVGLLAFAVAVLARVLDRGAQHPWPDEPMLLRRGARHDVTAISWSLAGREGRVSETAVRRLRDDARRRLALHGVHVPDLAAVEDLPPATRDAARALLGPAWDVLTARGRLLPTLRQVERCVAALESLAHATGPDSTDGALAVPRETTRTPPRDDPGPRPFHPRRTGGRTPPWTRRRRRAGPTTPHSSTRAR